MRALVPALLLLAAAPACATHPASSPAPVPAPPRTCACAAGDSVSVTYLGVGAFVLRRGGDAVLTAGMMSAPSPLDLFSLRTDTARVDKRLRAAGVDPRSVRAVLAGHSHYDHAMDLPYLMRRHFTDPAVKVWANAALPLIFAPDAKFTERVEVIERVAGDSLEPGEWRTAAGGRIRFMALKSDHAPHVLGRHLLPRKIEEPLAKPPRTLRDYAEGQTLAFLVDFLDAGGRTAFRLHVQDAASPPRHGFVPPLKDGDAAPVDVAVLCGAAFSQVRGYPETLLGELSPRVAVVGHLEDFILPWWLFPGPNVPFTSEPALNARIDGALGDPARRWTPRIGETRRFCVCARE